MVRKEHLVEQLLRLVGTPFTPSHHLEHSQHKEKHMSHFAKVVDGIVEQVIVADTKQWCETNLGGTWVQTSYNTLHNKHKLGGTPLRANYAGIGPIYDAEKDVFYAPQPYPSWVLSIETYSWEAPIPMPEDGKAYDWNEEDQTWVEITRPE